VRFRGKYEHTLDTKGRTSVPSKFRDVFSEIAEKEGDERSEGEVIVLTRSVDDCLISFPRSAWYAFEDTVATLPQLGRKAKLLKRIFIAHAVECTIDKHGRILIPQALRDYAGLERDVIWVGSLGTCNIWNPHRWEAALSEVEDDKDVLEDALSDLPI